MGNDVYLLPVHRNESAKSGVNLSLRILANLVCRPVFSVDLLKIGLALYITCIFTHSGFWQRQCSPGQAEAGCDPGNTRVIKYSMEECVDVLSKAMKGFKAVSLLLEGQKWSWPLETTFPSGSNS